MMSTSYSLLDGLKAKDQFAWTRFVERYQPFVWDICRRHGVSASDATDLVQDVFLGVFGSFASFDRHRQGASFHAWLRGVVRHKIANHFRNPPRAQGGTDGIRRLQELADPLADDTRQQGDRDPANQWIHLAADMVKVEFEPQTWEAFWRTAVHGRSAPDVARELGMSPEAVRKAKSRVRRRLKAELEGLD